MNLQTKDWLQMVRPYQKSTAWKSWWQVINSFVPFIFFWGAAFYALKIHGLLMVPLAALSGLFLVRIFIIQHDCGHGSFFKSKFLRDQLGYICGVLTLTPYESWQFDHSIHHAHSGNEDHRDIGEVPVLTTTEYQALPAWKQFLYRLYRHPFVLFGVAPMYMFFVRHRFPFAQTMKYEKLRVSVWMNNLGIAALVIWGINFFGLEPFLVVYFTIGFFATSVAVFLFYIQHQFEDGYMAKAEDWTLHEAAIKGCSYFKLPPVLQWFSGNIGFHHIHHLSPLVPNYELQSCFDSNPELQNQVTTLNLKTCWNCMKLRFWDDQQKKLISYKEYKTLYEN